MDRTCRRNINKEIEDFNDTIKQPDQINIFRTLHSTSVDYTLFSSANGTFFTIDPTLGQKTNLNKFKKTEFTQSLFYKYIGLKLKINIGRKIVKLRNTYKPQT